MFALFTFEASKKVFIIQYCEGQWERCERYRRRIAGLPVPDNLLPNGMFLENNVIHLSLRSS